MLHDPADKIKSCDFRESSSNSINGCFYCCCCSCCCFNTMPLCHSFSQGLNGSWPPTLHMPLHGWCLEDSHWRSRTNKGQSGTGQCLCAWYRPELWLTLIVWPSWPRPGTTTSYPTWSREVGRGQTSPNLSTPCGCRGDVKQMLLSCRRRRRRILTYRSHGSRRVNRKWVTYFSHVCHPVSRCQSFLATKAGDKRRGAVWVSEWLDSNSQVETR